jgi:transglutaminase-like putative cysteine protease
VTLGNFGNMLEDPEVVLRVKGLDGPLAPPLRMRGQSLDEYDGLTWRKTTQQRKQLSHDPGGFLRTSGFRGRPGEPGIRKQEIYLEPMAGTPRVLFGLPMPVAFERPSNALEALRPSRWRFYEDQAGDVTMTGPDAVSIVYTVYSDPRPEDPSRLRAATGEIPEWIRDAYIGLPPMDAGVASLARQIAANAVSPYDVALAVQDHLRSEYTYALGTDHGDDDPLSDFILSRREGHCEYFASAMVAMLRVLGIPARIVNGFYGGIRNDYGDYVSLRRADAHSWVEAYFPGEGWATFEPTPASAFALRSGRSWYQGMADALDALKLGWYRWVIEYNLEKQVHFLATLFRLKRGGDGFSDGTALNVQEMRRMRDRLKAMPWGRMLLAVPALVLLVLVSRFLWRRRRVLSGAARGGDSSVRAYRRLRKMLRRRGLNRDPGETQREFAYRVGKTVPEAGQDVLDVTGAYLEFEFGGREAGPGLDDKVARVSRALADRQASTRRDLKE